MLSTLATHNSRDVLVHNSVIHVLRLSLVAHGAAIKTMMTSSSRDLWTCISCDQTHVVNQTDWYDQERKFCISVIHGSNVIVLWSSIMWLLSRPVAMSIERTWRLHCRPDRPMINGLSPLLFHPAASEASRIRMHAHARTYIYMLLGVGVTLCHTVHIQYYNRVFIQTVT